MSEYDARLAKEERIRKKEAGRIVSRFITGTCKISDIPKIEKICQSCDKTFNYYPDTDCSSSSSSSSDIVLCGDCNTERCIEEARLSSDPAIRKYFGIVEKNKIK